MSALITYSHIDNNKNAKISTHVVGSIEEYLDFVLANKQYMVWANLTDMLNGELVESYVNIKNYQNSALDHTQLSIKGENTHIYRRVYIIHKLEFQNLVEFIKATNEPFYRRLVEQKAFKMLPFNKFIQNKIADQFYIFPADIYDITMGEFTFNLNPCELSDFQEKLPVAKELFVDVKETQEAA